MSDFEDDIDDQLLELAGATEKKKKRRQHSNSNGTSHAVGGLGGGSKKRKAEYALFIQFCLIFLDRYYQRNSFFLATHLGNELLLIHGLSFFFPPFEIPSGGWNLNLRKNQSRVKMKARIRTR